MDRKLNITVFYGSSTGNTRYAAKTIAAHFEETQVFDIQHAGKNDLEKPDLLILGISTWGLGDMQYDWQNFLKILQKANLKNKTLALFGLGDQRNYADTFVDALGTLHEQIKNKAKVIGFWPNEGYVLQRSKALENGYFKGLVLDFDNEADKTEERIAAWCRQLKTELKIAKS